MITYIYSSDTWLLTFDPSTAPEEIPDGVTPTGDFTAQAQVTYLPNDCSVGLFWRVNGEDSYWLTRNTESPEEWPYLNITTGLGWLRVEYHDETIHLSSSTDQITWSYRVGVYCPEVPEQVGVVLVPDAVIPIVEQAAISDYRLFNEVVPSVPEGLPSQTLSVQFLQSDPGLSIGTFSVTAEPRVHGLLSAQFGDLEVDIGKSAVWLQFLVDDLFLTDINTGQQRYWVVNWAATLPEAKYNVTGTNYFVEPETWRREQFEAASKAWNYEDDDWCVFIDGHECLSFDNRSFPDDLMAQPLKSWLQREIQRTIDNGDDRAALPFFAYLKYTDLQNVTYPASADPADTDSITQAISVPWYHPAGKIFRLFKVSALRDIDFDWGSIDRLEPHTDTGLVTLTPVGRHLYNSDGEPFFIVADTPWHLSSRLTQEQIKGYVAARKAQGFNTIQMVALSIYPDIVPGQTKRNIYDKYPFVGNESPDITQPLIVGAATDDDTSPDYDYWDHVRWTVKYIGDQGMLVNIVPMWLGYQGSSWRGYYEDTKATNYGTFIGTLLGSMPHVMWMLGGDNAPVGNVAQVPGGLYTGDVVVAVNNMANAIRAVSPRIPLMTYHTDRTLSAATHFFGQPWYNVYAAYANTWTWDYVEEETDNIPSAPTHMVEAYYDGRLAAGLPAPNLDRATLRAELYWSYLIGAQGTAYAHEFTCRMLPGWESYIFVDSASDIALMRDVVERLGAEWAPDRRGALPLDSMLSEGRGNGAVNVASVATSAVRKDRTYGVSYFLEARTPITVNLAKFNKTTVSLKWVNPENGDEIDIGTFGGTGTQAVTYPAGYVDALLIAEASGEDVAPLGNKAVTDQFDGTSPAVWGEHDPDNAASITLTPPVIGKLQVRIIGSGNYDISNTLSNAPKYLQQHQGDFDITVQSSSVVTGTVAPQTFRGWNLVAMNGPTGDCIWLSTYDTTTLTQRINFARRVGSTVTNYYNSTPAGGVPATLCLRLRRIGDTFTAYWGSSPYTVLSLGSQTWGQSLTHVGVAAVSGGAPSPYTVEFDFFSVDDSEVIDIETSTKAQVISYGYMHWNRLDVDPGEVEVEELNEANDDGYRMRCLLSLVRPIPAIPYGDPYGKPWYPPSSDPVSYPGPWAVDTMTTFDPLLKSTVEEAGHTPPHPITAGVGVPLYDTVVRLNLRDGLWYESGVSGNIPLAWDDTQQVWVPMYDPDQWEELGIDADGLPEPPPANVALRLNGASGTYSRTSDSAFLDYAYGFTLTAALAPDKWRPATRKVILSKWGAAGQRSYYWALDPDGIVVATSRDGTAIAEAKLTYDFGIFGDGEMVDLAVSFATDNITKLDKVTFWHRVSGIWVALNEVPVTAPNPDYLPLFNSNTEIEVGASTGGTVGNFAGLFRFVTIRSGVGEDTVGGSEQARMRGDLASNPSYDIYGNTWSNIGGWNYVDLP